MVESQLLSENTALRTALRSIRQDRNPYPASFGPKGAQITKQEVLKNLFGHKARHGETRIINDRKIHIPGYYDTYPELSHDQVNEIFAEHIIMLANATILMHQRRFLERDLEKTKRAVLSQMSKFVLPKT